MPLGIRPEGGYESGTVGLAAGDWLVIFTDGLVEALHQRQEEYGEPRMLKVLAGGPTETPSDLRAAHDERSRPVRRLHSAADDVTCMLLHLVLRP